MCCPMNLALNNALRFIYSTQCWSNHRTSHLLFASQISKYFSTGLKEDESKTNKQTHMFFRLGAWKTIEQLSDSLLNNVVHHTSGLVVINKPYGIASSTPPAEAFNKNVLTLSCTQMNNCHYTLSQTLPHLAQRLGYQKLTIVKAPERYTSGVAILSANDEVTNRVRRCLKRSKPSKQRTERYLAVAIGVPNENEATNKLGIVLKPSERKDYKYPVLISEWSNRAVQRGEIKLVSVDHRVLSVGPGGLASLVEVCPSATRWHFVRVFLATHLLSPALGDNLYGSRVAMVMGATLPVDPASDNARMPQKLSSEVLSALCLNSGDEPTVPTHIHLHSQTLIGYDNGKDLTLRAPIPEHFQATCDALGLELQSHFVPQKLLEL